MGEVRGLPVVAVPVGRGFRKAIGAFGLLVREIPFTYRTTGNPIRRICGTDATCRFNFI